MQDFQVLEPFPAPGNKLSFLLDWELTMKCNLDCSYCHEGIDGGHDNSTKHPPLDECLASLDFMYKYADLYMPHRIPSLRHVVLNVYGGESLHHPNIVEILEQAREKYLPYKDRWALTITTTTNAIVPSHKMAKIIPLIDEFTVSYHSEALDKQKEQFKANVLAIQAANREVKCVVLMHNDVALFEDSVQMSQWLSDNNIRKLERQLDHGVDPTAFNYTEKQIQWFDGLYNKRSHNTNITLPNEGNLCGVGRACCGGRQVSVDQNFKQRHGFVKNVFTGWSCSVNWFFLFVKQLTGDIYVNKDCKMSYNGIGPIGHLSAADKLLEELKVQLETNTLPTIVCEKSICFCGLCAPKAKDPETYQTIIKKYQFKE